MNTRVPQLSQLKACACKPFVRLTGTPFGSPAGVKLFEPQSEHFVGYFTAVITCTSLSNLQYSTGRYNFPSRREEMRKKELVEFAQKLNQLEKQYGVELCSDNYHTRAAIVDIKRDRMYAYLYDKGTIELDD